MTKKKSIQTEIPNIDINKLPKKGDRIGFQNIPDERWKVISTKDSGKTTLKNIKTGQRIVVKFFVKKMNPFAKKPGGMDGSANKLRGS